MNILPLPALNDNYIWLIEADNQCVCIDPGESQVVLQYLQTEGKKLNAIWVTHHHYDHTDGIGALQAAFPDCRVMGAENIAGINQAVQEGTQFTLGNYPVCVWGIPGHTAEHLAFVLDDGNRLHLFCGDTLFSAGCGRVFTGTIEQLQSTFARFATLPENTLFYPAHEYTAANLRFAEYIEPSNADIQAALRTATQTPTLPVQLGDEQKINPFLRAHLPHIAQKARQLSGKSLNNEREVFAALRQLKNTFKG